MGSAKSGPEARITTQPLQNPSRLLFGYNWLDKPMEILALKRNDTSIPAGVVKDFAHRALGERSSQFGEKSPTFELEHNGRLGIAFEILAQVNPDELKKAIDSIGRTP